MKQETMRARHPVQNKEKLAEKYLKEELIKKNSMPLLKYTRPIISSVFYYLVCLGRYSLFCLML